MKFYKRSDSFSIQFNLDTIIKKAEAAIDIGPLHITDYPAPLSKGGIHDYYSNGDYWWPNPATADGLPYIHRDGESNPKNFDVHRLILRTLRTNVANLTAAYYITSDEKYAEKAINLLKGFFLDEDTKMNPHLLYAQAIPGICTGRGIGIIDTLHLIDIPISISILSTSRFMNPDILSGLKGWFADYLNWMTTHQYGIDEMKAKNNHGVCWCVQAAIFGLFTENRQVVDFIKHRYKTILLPNQMALDGSFPLELKRTKPYGYSIFVLDNMITLCHVLSTPHDDLWNFKLADGRGIKKGLEFLFPYLVDKSKWPYRSDVEHFDAWPVAIPSLLFAGYAFSDTKYIELWESLDSDPDNMEVRRNIAIRQPMLWLL